MNEAKPSGAEVQGGFTRQLRQATACAGMVQGHRNPSHQSARRGSIRGMGLLHSMRFGFSPAFYVRGFLRGFEAEDSESLYCVFRGHSSYILSAIGTRDTLLLTSWCTPAPRAAPRQGAAKEASPRRFGAKEGIQRKKLGQAMWH